MIMFKRETDPAAISAFLRDTVWPDEARSPKDAFDFGDDATVGLHVKRVGYSLSDNTLDPNQVFGRYLGRHPDGYVVVVTGLLTGPHSCEIYDFLPELKQQWQLD